MDESLENLKTFDKLLLPFRKFKDVFSASKGYGKFALLIQCILFCSGPLFFGQIEIGLILFVLFFALAFGLGFISVQYFSGTLAISIFTYLVVSLILLAAVIAIFYVTFSKTVNLADKRNRGESTIKSFVFDAIYKLGYSIREWFKEFKLQFFKL